MKTGWRIGEIPRNLWKRLRVWWLGTELNRRRQPFQGCALPPELPGHIFWLTACLPAWVRLVWRVGSRRNCQSIQAVRTLKAFGTGTIITTERSSLKS